MKKTGLSLLLIILIGCSSCNFAPGSYPYAEEYKVNASELLLIKKVEEFKKNNPQYVVPKETQLTDGRRDSEDHWYHIYFYYPKENQIVYAWLRGVTSKKTTFAFVSINQSLNLGNWKDINKDFSRSENEMEKKKFEARILNKIIALLNEK